MSGTLVRTRAQFTDTTGQAADPTTVVLKYRKDAGSTTTVTYPSAPIVRAALGDFHADLDTSGWTGPGNQGWVTQWAGTGAVQVVDRDEWGVEPQAL